MSVGQLTRNKTAPATPARGGWLDALAIPAIWKRAIVIGLAVGLVQVLVNQGDAWLHLEITPRLIIKTALTLTVAFTVALLSTASGYIAFTAVHAQLTSEIRDES